MKMRNMHFKKKQLIIPLEIKRNFIFPISKILQSHENNVVVVVDRYRTCENVILLQFLEKLINSVSYINKFIKEFAYIIGLTEKN